MKTWSLAVIGLFLVFFATAGFAASPDAAPAGPGPVPGGPGAAFSGHHPQFGPGDMNGRPGFKALHHIVSYLGLTPEQIAKMRELRGRFRNETHDLRYDLAAKRLEMRKLFTDPKVDDATLMAKQKEIGSLQQKLMDKRAQLKIEWRKILTAEQIQKLDRIIPAGGFMGHRKGRGMGCGMGPGMGPGMGR
jgi:Spy/CpxP family protein refolding chaperone